jgi:hypothetical protein
VYIHVESAIRKEKLKKVDMSVYKVIVDILLIKNVQRIKIDIKKLKIRETIMMILLLKMLMIFILRKLEILRIYFKRNQKELLRLRINFQRNQNKLYQKCEYFYSCDLF